MLKKCGSLFLLLPVLALLSSACMWGVVRDSTTGKGIVGATITYTDSFGRTGTITSTTGGLYAFDSAKGAVPAIGPVDIQVSAPGYATLDSTRIVNYGDNPNATIANLSTFWDVESFDLTKQAEAGTISTLVSGVDFPVGAVYDDDGNFYFSDRDSCRVFRLSGGVLSVIAGTGTCGYSGDGGPATSARLNRPGGLAIDGDGNLAITDTKNCRIRLVDLSSHVITTVAGDGTCGFSGDGGSATSAQLQLSSSSVDSAFVWSDVAFDSHNNLYIADLFNCRIRKVTGGTVTTIAGSGATGFACGGFSGDGGPATSAQLDEPTSVAVDDHGNVFIGAACRVRKVSSGGTISTIAGSDGCTPSGNGGAAKDANLAKVWGMALDNDGSLFLSQFSFNTKSQPQYCQVRRIDENGKIYAVAGTGTCGFSGDGGDAEDANIQTPGDIAISCSDNLAFTNPLSGRVRIVYGAADAGPAPGNVCN
jgi:hypothetical protein